MQYYPDFSSFCENAANYRVLPVALRCVTDDETPISLYRQLKGLLPEGVGSFLLESAEGGERWGRFSFLGGLPYRELLWQDGKGWVIEQGQRYALRNTPIDFLRQMLHSEQAPKLPGLPPFSGGAVGFLGYDTVRLIETLPEPNHEHLGVPDLHMVWVDDLLAFDHLLHSVILMTNVHIDEKEAASPAALRLRYDRACEHLADMLAQLAVSTASGKPNWWLPAEPGRVEVVSNLSQSDFEEKVHCAQRYIADGDIFQVVLSQRFAAPYHASPLDLYRALRWRNSAPFLYLFEQAGYALVGASPELLVRVQNGEVILRPIAGTRPRGNTPQEDEQLCQSLMSDPKERAEHMMLLDLGRNDVGRVARFGSIQVTRECDVERYAKVQHLVSEVRGQLRPDLTALDALLAALPAGTVSGAPKVRAMQIIDELEPSHRGPYAGGFGYFGFNGNLDMCITIRTLILHKGWAYVQAGAGIVADSVATREYEETQHKASAMLEALQAAEVIR
ncbi:MAG: anthranilate synthase component I [Firmicutes bacterium]|nr:anthranilate synthase component I [Bacillota bacterium]